MVHTVQTALFPDKTKLQRNVIPRESLDDGQLLMTNLTDSILKMTGVRDVDVSEQV